MLSRFHTLLSNAQIQPRITWKEKQIEDFTSDNILQILHRKKKKKKEARIHVYKLCCEHRRLLCFKNTVDRGLTLQDKKSSGLVQEKGVVKAMNP